MDKQNDFNQRGEEAQNLQIWCCRSCEAVHFKVGKVLLNFTKTEFVELASSVNDVFQQEFGGLEFYNLIGSLTARDGILSRKTIS